MITSEYGINLPNFVTDPERYDMMATISCSDNEDLEEFFIWIPAN